MCSIEDAMKGLTVGTKPILVCGYSGHGKDYLFRCMVHGCVDEFYDVMYGFVPRIFDPNRLAFADEAKLQTIQRLHLPYDLESFNHLKDSTVISGKTLREHVIDVAQETVSFDRHFYARSVASRMMEDRQYVVTDLRFYRELEFFPSSSVVRVFNSQKPIPLHNTEHELDHLLTDVLLVNKGCDPEIVHSLFPQYFTLDTGTGDRWS